MAEIRPFHGIRYDQTVVGDLNQVISPPYDVISEQLQDELYERNPYNVVRMDFGKVLPGDGDEENRYTRACAQMRQWIQERALVCEERAAIYYLEEDYVAEDGRLCTRKGFVASVKLEDAESGLYRPHEKTLAKPKEDRIALTKACKANLSPIFSLYDDPEMLVLETLERTAKRVPPCAEVTDGNGVRTRLWVVSDEQAIETVRVGMAGKSFFIADGHHRYETGLAYRDWMRSQNPSSGDDAAWNYTMMYLSNMYEPGLSIFATHRAVSNLKEFSVERFLTACEEFFEVQYVAAGSVEELLQEMKIEIPHEHRFGVCGKGKGENWILRLRSELEVQRFFAGRIPEVLQTLDVTLLHSLVLDKILGVDEESQLQQKNLTYVKGSAELFRRVQDDPAVQLGFLLNPTRIDEVKRVAEAGYRMPQKSTFFYPKLATGLIFHSLDDDVSVA